MGIGIGDDVTLDVSGQWTNESVLAGGVGLQPRLQNGGSINLQLIQPTSELVLGNQVALKADAGAWEQSSGTITYDQKINGQQGPPLDITFFVSDEGDRLDGLVVDPGAVFSCELHRTSKND